jgi:hypothetical protein
VSSASPGSLKCVFGLARQLEVRIRARQLGVERGLVGSGVEDDGISQPCVEVGGHRTVATGVKPGWAFISSCGFAVEIASSTSLRRAMQSGAVSQAVHENRSRASNLGGGLRTTSRYSLPRFGTISLFEFLRCTTCQCLDPSCLFDYLPQIPPHPTKSTKLLKILTQILTEMRPPLKNELHFKYWFVNFKIPSVTSLAMYKPGEGRGPRFARRGST